MKLIRVKCKDGKIKTIELVFSNPKFNYWIDIEGDKTEAELRKQFVGRMFDVSKEPPQLWKCVNIKIINSSIN